MQQPCTVCAATCVVCTSGASVTGHLCVVCLSIKQTNDSVIIHLTGRASFVADKCLISQRMQNMPSCSALQAKVELDGEVRSLALTGSATYAELLHNIHEKFPSSGPVILKYLDRWVFM